MNILRAEHLGMCFGVRDAIALARQRSKDRPLTVLGDLVHNETVLEDLRARGVRIVATVDEVETPAVMITAHGASEQAVARVRDRGFDVTEATCPLVRSAHRALVRLVKEGCHPVVVGKRGHVEVRGLTEDFSDFDVVLTEADLFELEERPRFGVIAQTTQPIERVRYLVRLLRWRFPRSEVCFIDTVCQPTKQRQHAAVELAQHADIVIVIGGENSNNTRELVRTCGRYCRRVHHIQTAAELRAEWLAEAQTVGLTAGTSTPDEIVDAVEARLWDLSRTAGVSAQPLAPRNEEHEYHLASPTH